MKLNIVNPSAGSYNESVGITPERSEELGRLLNEMSNKFKGQLVRTHDIFNEIAEMCNNTEELIFVVVSHCNYMALKYRVFLCPPK